MEKTQLKSTKSLLCVDKLGAALTYHYLGYQDTKQFGEKNQKIVKDSNDNFQNQWEMLVLCFFFFIAFEVRGIPF